MIKESIQFIADKLTELNIFEKVYSQVELVIDNGTAYVRKNGKISISDIDLTGFPACQIAKQLIIPLRVVGYKRKSKLPVDCSYTEDILAETIFSYLSNNTKDLKRVANAIQVKIKVISIDTNSSNVWNDETNGVEQVDINYEIACVALDLELELIADTKCLTNECLTNA